MGMYCYIINMVDEKMNQRDMAQRKGLDEWEMVSLNLT